MDKARLLYLQNRVAYARDQIAYKELYIYFHPSIYKLAKIIAQDENVVEEIVSDVMIRVWTMENKLAYVENLKAYLFTATRNTAITYLKKHQIQYLSETQPITDAAAYSVSAEPLLTMEIAGIIESTVQALPKKCQLVYRLIKEEGLCYKETCEVLQVSQKTLESHMSAALKKLRQALDAYLL